MKKNKIKLLEAIVDKVSDDTWGPSGSVKFQVNDKEVEVIIHGSGELDFEGDYDELEEDEEKALIKAFNSSKMVQINFPNDEYP